MSGSEFTLSPEVKGIIYALLLAIAYTAAGYLSVNIASKKPFSMFVGVIFGSMVIRLVVTIVIIWFLMAVIGIHQLAFSLAFIISYFIFLMIEIIYINARHNALAAKDRQSLRRTAF